MPLAHARRVYAVLPQLPQLRQQIKKLQAEVKALQAHLEGDGKAT
jgi:phosphoribosylpyrophosphate synthetase